MNVSHTDCEGEIIVIPLFGIVVYPESRSKFPVDKETGDHLLAEIETAGVIYAAGLTVRNGTERTEITAESLYETGTLLRIVRVLPAEEGCLVCAHAGGKVRVLDLVERNGRFSATCTPVHDIQDLPEDENAQMLVDITATITGISSRFPGSEQFVQPLDQLKTVDQVISFIMPFLPVGIAGKQALLEETSVRKRAFLFLEILMKTRDDITLRFEMAKKVADRVNRSNREAMLREQLRVIQEELNEGGSNQGDGDYRERIESSEMPAEVRKKAFSELKKLETGGSQSHESQVIRNYLDLLLDLPWALQEVKSIDIQEARRVLDRHHNGLEKVKERIVQHLAVMKLKGEKQGSILLFAGPPGTGKTSLGKSIAEALGRQYVRISLGGMRDEAEIRGHRRTYVGALPGRIIQGMQKAGTRNPVFVLDEIDKLAVSYSGDPASALLEVLDPEQNNTFSDHYLEVPYDLSDVLFIATANSLATIPAPLLDRMELIEIPGYTTSEKFAIAKDHLLPATLREHGLDGDTLRVDDTALHVIIETYTREAGVRWLKKQLAKVARHVSEKIVSGEEGRPFVVTAEMLPAILGKEPIRLEVAGKEPVPGVVTGLAWTPAGGEILFIEGTFMAGTGKLTLTGQLGDVMKESATISLSLIRSRLAGTGDSFDFIARDIHIHVPSGATPKDGPSAGVALFTTLASLITGRAVDPHVAMTGEVTLRGAVMPVGGIREKVLAAHRAGIRKVILPRENERDLQDVPPDVRRDLVFTPVETVDEVLKEALGIDLPRPLLVQAGDPVIPVQNI